MKNKEELDKWANQEIIIKCTMAEAGDLMDLLFIADGGPFNNYFKNTIKLNNMTKAYSEWLNKMVNIVCGDEMKDETKRHKRIIKNKR